MDAVNIAIACIATLILVMSLFTRRLRHNLVSEPTLALLLGVAIGPVGLGWLSLEGDDLVLEQTARFTLALVLVSVGLGLPHRYLVERWRSLSLFTLGGMTLRWAINTLLLAWLLPLELLPALLIGAVITPLDPVLASGVAVGKVPERELPGRIRHLLSLEAASSHGLGYLLVLLPAFLITRPPLEAWSHWLTSVLLWDGLGAILLGALIGALAGRAHRWSLRERHTETGPLITTFVGLSLATVALLQILGSADLLAVLVAGISYANSRTSEQDEELNAERLYYETTFKQILQVPVFVLLGVALPWSEWLALGWPAVGLVVAVLLLRRLPTLLLLKPIAPGIRGWDEALFIGWFGTIGVGALHFALIAQKHAHLTEAWIIGSLLIAASTVVHDLTLRPFTSRLKRRIDNEPV